MEIILGWILFSLLFAMAGSGRTCGYWGSFLLCFFLSPVLGIIITLFFPSVEDRQQRQQILSQQHQLLQQQSQQLQKVSVSDELVKLKQLHDAGTITPEEYQQLKNKLIAQVD